MSHEPVALPPSPVRAYALRVLRADVLPGPVRRLKRRYLDQQERHWRLLIAVQVLYGALIGSWLVYTHSWPTPDHVAILLLIFATVSGRGVSFVRDWSPFVLLVLAYEALRGIADGLIASAHVQFPIDADRALFFGELPTLWLQERLWDPENIRWYDYLAAFMHPMHFLVPLVLAFVFWMWRYRLYWRFVGSYLLLTYAGFITYLLYPMAPPWWAARAGVIPPVDGILEDVLWRHSISKPIVLTYDKFGPNPVAAMPSLHAAFPVLVWLVLWRVWPRWGWAAVVYPLMMGWSIVYMGEHYVVDVYAGWLYGAAAFYAVWLLPERWARFRSGVAIDDAPGARAQENTPSAS